MLGVLRTESSFRPTTGRGICIKLPILIPRKYRNLLIDKNGSFKLVIDKMKNHAHSNGKFYDYCVIFVSASIDFLLFFL